LHFLVNEKRPSTLLFRVLVASLIFFCSLSVFLKLIFNRLLELKAAAFCPLLILLSFYYVADSMNLVVLLISFAHNE